MIKPMPLIYITGPTGSGKSTICKALNRQGFKAYDTDTEGMRKIQDVDGKELLSLDLDIIQKMYDSCGNSLVYICGTSPNDLSAQTLFSKILLLTIDEAEQRKRILHRSNNQYGKKPHQLANAQKWRQLQIEKYQNAGAVEIDATLPLKDVLNQIALLSRGD